MLIFKLKSKPGSKKIVLRLSKDFILKIDHIIGKKHPNKKSNMNGNMISFELSIDRIYLFNLTAYLISSSYI